MKEEKKTQLKLQRLWDLHADKKISCFAILHRRNVVKVNKKNLSHSAYNQRPTIRIKLLLFCIDGVVIAIVVVVVAVVDDIWINTIL